MPITRFSWLSFADPTKPEGTQFLGAILGCGDFEDVYWAVNAAGINPGGEVKGYSFTTADVPEDDPTWNLPLMVLLSVDDMEQYGVVAVRESGDSAREPSGGDSSTGGVK